MLDRFEIDYPFKKFVERRFCKDDVSQTSSDVFIWIRKQENKEKNLNFN